VIKTADRIYHIPAQSQDNFLLEGSGKKKLLLLLNSYPLKEDEKQLLQKMMDAIGFHYDEDVFRLHLISDKNLDLSYFDLDYNNMISFGVKAEKINLYIPNQPYRPVVFDTMWALFADELSSLKNDPAKKQQLWSSLKIRFLTK
jgi:hypothetical protein